MGNLGVKHGTKLKFRPPHQFWSHPPGYLAAADRARLERLRQAVAARRAELDEQARQARVQAWLQPLIELDAVDSLDQPTTEQLLKSARQPPAELCTEERNAVAPIVASLTAHLDRMSVDEIMHRIEHLPVLRQQEILARLTALVAGGA
jgi:hypothetical protein